MGQPSGGSNPEATVACAYERDDILTGKITTTFRGYPWNKTNAVETDQPRSSPNPDVTIRSLRNRGWSSGKNAVLRSPRRMCILGDAPAWIDCPSRYPQAAEHQRTNRNGSKIIQLTCLSKIAAIDAGIAFYAPSDSTVFPAGSDTLAPAGNGLYFSTGPSDRQQAAPHCNRYRVSPVIRPKLAHQILDMKIDRGLGNCQLIRNLFIAITVSNEPQHFKLSVGEAFVAQMLSKAGSHCRRYMPISGVNRAD